MAQKKMSKKGQAESAKKGEKRPSDGVKASASGKKIKPEPQKALPPPEEISPSEVEDKDEEVPTNLVSTPASKKPEKNTSNEEDDDEDLEDDGEDENEGTNGVEDEEEDDEQDEQKEDDEGGDEGDAEDEEPKAEKEQSAKKEVAYTLYVGNLSFTADEDMVRDYFGAFAEVKEVRIAMRDGKSRGFCHVDFATDEDLQKALLKNGQSLAGRQISCDIAGAKGSNRLTENCNVFVKNFDKNEDETTIREQLTEIFGKCGEINCIRIPTDRDTGSIKGFAFIEFASSESVSKAAKYHGTQMGGRAIVVDTNTHARPDAGGRGRGRGRGGGRGRGRRDNW